MKKMLSSILLLGLFVQLAAAECVAYGNTVGRYSKVLKLEIKRQPQLAQFFAELEKQPKMAMISISGRCNEFATPEDVKKVTDYVKRGGILFMDQASPCRFLKNQKGFDLSPIAPILGKSSYVYDAGNIRLTELGKLMLGEDFKLAQGRQCGLAGKGTMKDLATEGKFTRIGINVSGKGLVVYYYMTTPPPAKFFDLLLDDAFRAKHFPEETEETIRAREAKEAARTCTAFGNSVGRYAKVLNLEIKRQAKMADFVQSLEKQPKMAMISIAGRCDDYATPEETKKVIEYVKRGGILFLDQGSTGRFKGKSGYDLSPIAPILGKTNYVYEAGDIQLTELGKTMLGEDFKLAQGRQCGLAGQGLMKDLARDAKFTRIGINAYGKGLVVYYYMTTPPPAKFFEQLLNDEFRAKNFPASNGNGAVRINGKVRHLAIAGGPKFFHAKMQEITGANFFQPAGIEDEVVISFRPAKGFAFALEFTDGKNIVLSGNVEFAAAEFLQRFAGYRNFGYGWFNEVLEKHPVIDLPAKFSIREKPDINSYTVAWKSNNAYGRSLRSAVVATHSLSKVVPVDRYAKTHPEYFPMVNGKRVIPVLKGGTWNPCMSNPDLPKLLREYFKAVVTRNPDVYAIPLGVNDGQGDCRCPKCEALYEKYGNQYAEFYNLAGRELKKMYPDKIVGFIAYGPRVFNAPKGLRMEDNILVQVCAIGGPWETELEKWKQAGIRHTAIYDYQYANGSRYVVPRHFPKYEAERWRQAVRKYGLEALWIEYYPKVECTETLRMYVLDRVAWNLNSDIDALIDDYCTKMFGTGANAVKAFYARLEEIFCRKPPLYYFADNNNRKQFANYTRADVACLSDCLDRAVKESQPGIHRKKAELLRKFWSLSRLYIENDLTIRELETEKDPEKAVRLAAAGIEGLKKIDAYTFTPEEESGIFLKGGFAHFQNQSRLNPRHPLNHAIELAFNRITANFKSPEKAKQFWAKYPSLQGARNQLYQLTHQEVNLLRNPGFEPNDAKTELPFGDMAPFKGVAGWGVWHFQNSVTEFASDYKIKRSGKASGRIGENQVSGCFQTGAAVEAGATYRFGVWVRRSDDNGGKALGSVSIRMTEFGAWADQGSAIGVNFTPECVGKFVYYSTTFTVPNRAGMAVLPLLGAPIQKKGSFIWFDDAELVKIGELPKEEKLKMLQIIPGPGCEKEPQVAYAMKTVRGLINRYSRYLPAGTCRLTLKSEGKDGAFRVQTVKDGIEISGDAEGLRCGLYAMLNHLGIHWFTPVEQPIGPESPVKTDWKRFAGLHKPDFSYRGLHICGPRHFDDKVAAWMSFNRMNRKLTHLPEVKLLKNRLNELGLKPDTTVHAYSLLIPVEKYYRKHPEFFPLVGGKRITTGAQLCLSNPQMRECFADELLEQIRQNPNLGAYGICPNDGYGHCECADCVALDRPEDRAKRLVNGRIADFVRDICAKMDKKAPGVMLGHYSYSNFSNFMELLKTPPENLLVSVTMFHCYKHGIADPACPENRKHKQRLEHIRSKVKHVYIYDYFSHQMGNQPGPFRRAIHQDFRYYRKLKLDGWMSECSGVKSPAWKSQWMNYYLPAKLLWNASLDPDKLLAETCLVRYGKAAAAMKQYWLTLDDAAAKMPGCLLKKPDEFPRMFTEKVQKRCSELLAQANRLSPNNPRIRMEQELHTFRCNNIRERNRYRSAAVIKIGPFKENAPAQPVYLVDRSSQLPDRSNDTEVRIFDEGTHLRFLIFARESVMKKLRIGDNPYGGDCIELFLDDGQNKKLCYHYLLGPTGNIRASACEGPRWNWSWQHHAEVKGTPGKNGWMLDVRIPYSDIHAGDNVGFSLIRNRYAGGAWQILGAPAGGAFFKIEQYIRLQRTVKKP